MIEEKPASVLEVVTPDGEVLDADFVRFAYTREGRRSIGKEFPNPVPLEPPLGFVPQKPIHEQIRDMVVAQLSAQAAEAGEETMEEADDFDVGEDFDPHSPYELDFEPTEAWPGRPDIIAAEEAALDAAGGGGAQPPGDKPPEPAPPAPPAKPT